MNLKKKGISEVGHRHQVWNEHGIWSHLSKVRWTGKFEFRSQNIGYSQMWQIIRMGLKEDDVGNAVCLDEDVMLEASSPWNNTRVVCLTFVQNISLNWKKKSTKINSIYFLVRDKRIPLVVCLFFSSFYRLWAFSKFREWLTINLKLKYCTKNLQN